MAERDIFEYVYEWMGENIEVQTYLDEEGEDDRPQKYAEHFIANAESDGYSQEDINSIRPRLEEIISQYMTQQTDAEVRRLADEDD